MKVRPTRGGVGSLAVVCALLVACSQKVQMDVSNDKPNDLRIALSLPGGTTPTLSKVRVLAIPSDSVLWQAEGPPSEIDEISYGEPPANFNELSPATPLAAGGRVSFRVSGEGVSGALEVRIKED